MEKKFKFIQISLTDLVFYFENSAENMAKGVFEAFKKMVFPVFPNNGAQTYNRIQEKRRKKWLYRFMTELKIYIDLWIEENK